MIEQILLFINFGNVFISVSLDVSDIEIKEEIKHWIVTIKITIYRTFILSFKHFSMYIKERAILEGCQESFCLKHYFEKTKKWYKNKNKDDRTIIIQNWLKKIKSYKNIKKTKKKKSSNNLEKVRIKILVENLRIRQKKYIKEAIDIYIKRIIKDLNEKIFKYYIYTEHYNVALDFIQSLRLEKTLNIIFNKEP